MFVQLHFPNDPRPQYLCSLMSQIKGRQAMSGVITNRFSDWVKFILVTFVSDGNIKLICCLHKSLGELDARLLWWTPCCPNQMKRNFQGGDVSPLVFSILDSISNDRCSSYHFSTCRWIHASDLSIRLSCLINGLTHEYQTCYEAIVLNLTCNELQRIYILRTTTSCCIPYARN